MAETRICWAGSTLRRASRLPAGRRVRACTPHPAAEDRPGNPNHGVAATTGCGARPGPRGRAVRAVCVAGNMGGPVAIDTKPNAAFCTVSREIGLYFQLPQVRALRVRLPGYARTQCVSGQFAVARK